MLTIHDVYKTALIEATRQSNNSEGLLDVGICSIFKCIEHSGLYAHLDFPGWLMAETYKHFLANRPSKGKHRMFYFHSSYRKQSVWWWDVDKKAHNKDYCFSKRW